MITNWPVRSLKERDMNILECASLIVASGAFGGFSNSLINKDGFVPPSRVAGAWYPGSTGNIVVGAFAAFASWALYGSGAAIDVAKSQANGDPNRILSLTLSAIAGAFVVGVAGAKWINGEVDKQLLKESVRVAATSKALPAPEALKIAEGSPRQVLERVREACGE
jgi:hypothetical protein